MSNIPSQFISVDWGTSNFRANLVQSDTLSISATICNDHGIKKVYEAFTNQNEKNQKEFFLNFLLTTLQEITTKAHSAPIIASGMVSSSIGLKELPYSTFPLNTLTNSIHYESINTSSGNDLIVISGARDEVGFMRGEEVQAIGLSDIVGTCDLATLILCGTHSKHLLYQQGAFQSMKNFMSGELFEVLVNHSLLMHSVVKEQFTIAYKTAFLNGVDKGMKEKLNAILLDVRYADLIKNTKGEENYYYLSGMLIGNELAYLCDESFPIYLGATGPLYDLYGIALKHIITEERIKLIDQEEFRKATIKGHFKILKGHIK